MNSSCPNPFQLNSGQSPKFYRFFQVLNESKDEVMLPAGADQKLRTTVEVGQDTYKKFEIKPDTKIYTRVTTEKVSWTDGSAKPQV